MCYDFKPNKKMLVIENIIIHTNVMQKSITQKKSHIVFHVNWRKNSLFFNKIYIQGSAHTQSI